MNLLSSKERFGTGSPAHSSTGAPLAPNPLYKSSVRMFKSVVGASCMSKPLTEFGSVAAKTSKDAAKTIKTTSFSDFIYFLLWVGSCEAQGKRVVFIGRLIPEERYLLGVGCI